MADHVDTHAANEGNDIDSGGEETTDETVLVTFRGGTPAFTDALKNWLGKHPEWPSAIVSGPDTCYILVVEVDQDVADAMYERLKTDHGHGDQPDDLYVAGVPEKGFRSKRFVRGKNADKFDPAKREMVLSDRKVGLTPGQLADNDGW